MFLAIEQPTGTLVYYISLILEVLPLFFALFVLYKMAMVVSMAIPSDLKIAAGLSMFAMPVFLFAQYGQLDALVNEIAFVRAFFDSAWLIFNTSVMGAFTFYAKHIISKYKD
jgi:hypothetical protein